MSTAYLWLKWLHVVSSTVLLGTGAGIAFLFVRAHETRDVRVIAPVARQRSIALYLLIGACWLPVVWLQIRMRNLAVTAATQSSALPPQYARLYRW